MLVVYVNSPLVPLSRAVLSARSDWSCAYECRAADEAAWNEQFPCKGGASQRHCPSRSCGSGSRISYCTYHLSNTISTAVSVLLSARFHEWTRLVEHSLTLVLALLPVRSLCTWRLRWLRWAPQPYLIFADDTLSTLHLSHTITTTSSASFVSPTSADTPLRSHCLTRSCYCHLHVPNAQALVLLAIFAFQTGPRLRHKHFTSTSFS